ncbi:hypothetical protein RI054_28g114880 [Pseudoscourfieldia marina]
MRHSYPYLCHTRLTSLCAVLYSTALLCSSHASSLALTPEKKSPCPFPFSLVSRKWSYVPRGAFQGSSWNNYHGCLYTFTQIGDDNVLNLENSKGCLDDTFVRARATWHKNNNSIDITFEIDKGTYTTTTATFAADCSLLDTADGGMYVGGHDGGRDHPMDFAPHEWLEAATAWVVRAATVTPQQTKGLPRHITPGIPVAPGAPPAYQAIYMRDGYYGIKHAFDLVNASMRQDWLASFEYLLERPRADGVLPVSCHPDDSARGPYCEYGAALMCNDTVGHPGWSTCRTLDSGPFAALLAAHVYDNFFASNEQAVAWYEKWSFTLIEGLMQTTRNPDGCGLVWSNTTQPNVGYGFQDTVRKSGDVLYSSILFWQACAELSRIAESSGDVKTSMWLRGLAEGMREAASARLWDSSVGAFRASTKVESDHVDVWGNALAAHLHFATEEQETSIFAFFQRRERDIFYEGQVREILFPEQWSEAWPDWSVRSYQNGGYWATPHHHVLPFLARHDRAMACRLLNATISSFRGHGIWEWVGPFWPSVAHGAPGYVASAANTRAASRELACMTL